MQSVNLGEPFEKYFQELVASGYYASASEVLGEAIRFKMEHNEKWKVKQLKMLNREGLDDIEAGRVVPYDHKFWEKINASVQENNMNNKPVPEHVRS